MNLRRIAILVVGIGLLAVIVVLVWPSSESEPTVKGQPISIWLRNVSFSQVGEVAEAGTNAIPFLMRAVRARDLIPYALRFRAWSALPAPVRSNVLPPLPASQRRLNALWTLREFGPEAEPALDVILNTAKNDADITSRRMALIAAVAINASHPKVLAHLKHDLQSTNTIVRSDALFALCTADTFPLSLTNLIRLDAAEEVPILDNELVAIGALGPDIAPFVPRILASWSHHGARTYALTALHRAGPGAVAAVPALIGCLRTGETDVRCQAVEVLMGIGPLASEAVPALEALMQDKVLALRLIAAAARGRITGDPLASVPVISAALSGSDDGSGWLLSQSTFGLHNCALNAKQAASWFAGELGPAARESALRQRL
jgi:HEAT repeat protein